MKILITGATGFIGAHLLEHLVSKTKNEIVILKRSFSNTWRIRKYIDKLKTFDVDKEDVFGIIKRVRPDIVIHLATYYRKYHSYQELPILMDSNINFPARILEAMASENIKFFINTGTFFECICAENSFTPRSLTKPFNLYASTKLAFEEIMKFYLYNCDMKGVTLKLFSPYGYKDNPNKLIPYLISRILKDEEAEVTAGEQALDFTYVKDIVKAYIRAIEYLSHMKEPYQIFEIGMGAPHKIREIIFSLEKISGKTLKAKWGTIPYAENEIFYSKANITNTLNFLKWIPEYNLEEGLKETYEWYKMMGEENGPK